MNRLVIKNGRVVDPRRHLDTICDVVIENGLIAAVAENLPTSAARVFDASNLVVAPGFIDMHVHLREPGFEGAETIETGSRAAAAGGFTSVCCMPNTNPVNDRAEVTSYIVQQARKAAVVNVFPIGAITKKSAGEEVADAAAMKAAGAVAISDDGKPVMNARIARKAMELANSLQLTLIEHCEDLNLTDGGDMHEGSISERWGVRGIPRSSEDVMVARDLILSEVTGCRYHVAHISSYLSVAMVAFAKARGLRVTAEATPHHFVLADTDIEPHNGNYKMKPPIRESRDVQAVTEGLADGTIDAIATDHAPHPAHEKAQAFERCPFGIIGLETALSLALERLYHPAKVTLTQLVSMFTTNPARILSLETRGTLRIGSPADVTIFSPDRTWTYNVNKSPSKSRNTPFNGKQFRGGPLATIVAGRIVWSFPD